VLITSTERAIGHGVVRAAIAVQRDWQVELPVRFNTTLELTGDPPNPSDLEPSPDERARFPRNPTHYPARDVG
jgi:hypothetical protein